MTLTEERARQAEMDAARAREIEEERLSLVTQRGSAALPDIRSIHDGLAAKVIREYIRAVLVPPIVKRLYDTGMGIATFDTIGPFGVVLKLEAPPAVQVNAMRGLMEIGVPRLRGAIDGEGSPIQGVIVLGTLEGLTEARRRAHEHRMEDHGLVGAPVAALGGGGGYVPPPGHTVTVIEDDLSKVTSGIPQHPSPDDAPRPVQGAPLTKAQQLAAKRRANGKTTNGR